MGFTRVPAGAAAPPGRPVGRVRERQRHHDVVVQRRGGPSTPSTIRSTSTQAA